MIDFLHRLDRRDYCVLLFTVIFAGLIYSKWFLSVCLLAFFPIALLTIDWSPKFKIGFRKPARQYWQVYLSHPPYWALGIIVLVVLFSVLYTGPSEYWYERLRIKAPFLLAPILMALIPPIPKRHLTSWMLAVISIGLVSLFGILGNYFLNLEAMNEGLRMGQAIPTPISHIRYSLFIVLCLILALWLSFTDRSTTFRKWFPAIAAFLFLVALHILSVRSGLLAAYLVIFTGIIYITVGYKNWRFALAGLTFLILFPILAYQFSPSLQTRLSYARYDLNQYLKGSAQNNSDSDRIVSFKVGWQTFTENKWLGTGVANFKATIKQKYSEQYPNNTQQKFPHNQYLSLLGSLGIVGFILSMFGFLLPLFWSKQYLYFPLAAFYLVILTSMLFENTWESSVGLNLFLLPTLMMLNYLSGKTSHT